MNDLKVWKAIFEVRYPPAATLFDIRGKIASKWQWTSDLSEWRISNNQVDIHNKSNSTFLSAGFRKSVTIMEQPDTIEDFIIRATDFSTDVLISLKVDKIERVGLRLLQLAERKHLRQLVDKMRKALFKLEYQDWNSLGGYPVDIAFHLTLKLGENNANFNLGPMENDRLVRLFESFEVQKNLPSISVFLDFDLNRTDPKWARESYKTHLGEFIESGTKQILEMTKNFLDRFGGFQ